MRIKYLGAKIAIILLAIAATPVVWGALAWPEWSKPNEAAWGEAVTGADSQLSAVEVAAPEPTLAPQPTPEIIRRTVVIERPVYIDVVGTGSGGGVSAPQPAGTGAQTQFAAVPAAVIPSAPSSAGAPPAAPTGNTPASAPAPTAPPPPPPPPAPTAPPAPAPKPAPAKAPSSGTTKGS